MADIPDLGAALDDALHLRESARRGLLPPLLAGKAVAVVFEKNSTRTRVSFDIGIQRLGGMVSILDAANSQMARGESVADTAAVLGRYADAIVLRTGAHSRLADFATHAGVPVINALTDLEHPCQVLADMMALRLRHGDLRGLHLAYVGDGNNMCHSYLLGAPLAGMDIAVATPPGHAPDPAVVARAQQLAREAGTRIRLTHDPRRAAAGAHAIATDTWISMGDEDEREARLHAFAGYTVNEALFDVARPDAAFLHCLPGHWGEEATEDVAHGPRSLILDQAEGRMWVQMALLCRVLGVRVPRGPRAA